MNRVTLIGAALVALTLATAWAWSRLATPPPPAGDAPGHLAEPGRAPLASAAGGSGPTAPPASAPGGGTRPTSGAGTTTAVSPPAVPPSGSTGDAAQLREMADAWTELATQLPAFREGRGELYAQWRALLDDSLGSDEADFYLALMGGDLSWPEMRALIHEHSRLTGQDYRELELQLGLNSGEISLEELEQLAAGGLPLPDWSALSLAWQGRVDDIASLAARGHLSDLDIRNPLNGNTTLGTFISHVAGGQMAPEEAARNMASLLALGVDTTETTRGQDALAQVLSRVGPGNAVGMHALAEMLIAHGHPVTAQHLELASRIASPGISDRMVRLLGGG